MLLNKHYLIAVIHQYLTIVNLFAIISVVRVVDTINFMTANLLEILIQSGIGEKSAKAYLALLEIKTAAASVVARKINLPRSTTYNILKGLQKEGLASESRSRGTTYFTATDPRHILDRNREILQKTEEALPVFMQIAEKYQHTPYITTYDGRKGLKVALGDCLQIPNKETLVYGSAEETYNYFPDLPEWFIKKRIKQNIFFREILEESDFSLNEKRSASKEKRIVKLLPKNVKLASVTTIYDDKVAIISFQNETAVIIQDQPYADTQRQLFELMWQQLK